MAEKLDPPPQSSAEELAGLDPAARDAVLRAEDEALIAYAKAMKACKEALDLKAKAGVVRAPIVEPKDSSLSEQVSAEGTSEEEE